MKDLIDELKYEIEMYYADDCIKLEKYMKKKGLKYICTCPDPYKWTDDEVLDWVCRYWEWGV